MAPDESCNPNGKTDVCNEGVVGEHSDRMSRRKLFRTCWPCPGLVAASRELSAKLPTRIWVQGQCGYDLSKCPRQSHRVIEHEDEG